MPNRLANETSPYLLQHKDNPVDWYPWGDEAFAEARASNRPVMLSVGYSACHWCHVMERESFESHETAALMNRLFVNIKVDREERPDVDGIYMAAVQAMTGHGGWPMTVFLTPDGKPFYGGTYFPNDDRGGLPAFPRVLQAVSDAYHDDASRGQLLQQASNVVSMVQSRSAARASDEPLTMDLLANAALAFQREFDPRHGGMGLQPKFPQPLDYELLLRHWHATGDEQSLRMVDLTLEKMANGGIYDHLGGGFARYSTDTFWLVPHFEKMLYDNAQLATLYLHAWQATGRPLFRRVVEETLGYLLREMRHESGGFYSAQDADSEGEEGKFYVWLPEEIDRVLGPELSRVAKAYWGVTREGNFEGKNILNVAGDEELVAAQPGIGVEEFRAGIAEARSKLYETRSKRVWPGLDDKVLASWNAMAMKAFAECGAAMARPEWVDAARQNAAFTLDQLHVNGRLRRTWKDGSGARLNAYLEDYAWLIEGLISLYEATFERRWFDAAVSLADEMAELFWSPDENVFYDTGSDHEELLVRPREAFDNAVPCGGSVAAHALLKLAVFTGTPEYQRMGAMSLRSSRDMMARVPAATAGWISAAAFYLSTKQEVVIVGGADDPATKALIATARRGYHADRIFAGAESPDEGIVSPLLEGREAVAGKPTAFVCESYACKLPVTTPEDLAAQLAAG